MPALPATSDFSTVPSNHVNIRTALVNQREFLAGLLGADGLPATALSTLGALASVYSPKSATYTVQLADRGRAFDATTGTWAFRLPAVASAGNGFSVLLRNSGTGTITVDPSGAELVDGATTTAVAAGRVVLLVCTGTAWVSHWMWATSAGGGGGGGGLPADGSYGDLSVSGAWTNLQLNPNVVTNAELAQMSGLTIKGNNTVGVANAADLTPSQVKTLLAIGQADVSGLVTDLAAKAPLDSPTFTGTPSAPTAGGGTNTTQIATTAFVTAAVNAVIAAADAMVFKGVIDCSANPNYPAADRGWTYRVSVAGKIGGASGPNVEVGDMLFCITDGTAAGNHAAVGAQWNIAQANVDGAVAGPTSATSGNPVVFSGTSGRLVAETTFASFKASLAISTADVSGLGSLATLSSVSLTTNVAGVLPAANGGTGQSTLPLALAALMAYTETATAAGTTTLTASSTYLQGFTGSSTQTVVLPGVNTLPVGFGYVIANKSTGALTLNSLNGTTICTIAADEVWAMNSRNATGGGTAVAWNVYRISSASVANAQLALMAANTIKVNATAGSATPTDLAIGASQLLGRGPTGNLAALSLGTNLSITGTTLNATGGGGGGSPGGVSGQVQVNNAGAFAGAANVEIEGGDLRLDHSASPGTPAAGGVKLVGRTSAGKTRAAMQSQDGRVRLIQPHLGLSNALRVSAISGANTFSNLGAPAPTLFGTATAAAVATTNRHTRQPRCDILVTVAATTAIAGFRLASPTVTVGGASASEGGFEFSGVWGPATGVATTTLRAAFGLFQSVATPTDVEPSSINNGIWMGWDAADTNVQIMSKNNTGTATKIDLGASFPVPTTDRTALYQLELTSPPGTTSQVDYTVTDLVNPANVSSGSITITTDLPANNVLLGPRGWCSVGGTSSVVGFALSSLYLDPLI